MGAEKEKGIPLCELLVGMMGVADRFDERGGGLIYRRGVACAPRQRSLARDGELFPDHVAPADRLRLLLGRRRRQLSYPDVAETDRRTRIAMGLELDRRRVILVVNRLADV